MVAHVCNSGTFTLKWAAEETGKSFRSKETARETPSHWAGRRGPMQESFLLTSTHVLQHTHSILAFSLTHRINCQDLTPSWGVIGNWWFLGKGELLFCGVMMTDRLSVPQWMTSHTFIHGQPLPGPSDLKQTKKLNTKQNFKKADIKPECKYVRGNHEKNWMEGVGNGYDQNTLFTCMTFSKNN